MSALQVPLLYSILNSIKDSLILMNKHRTVEWVNDVHARVWGRPPESFTGRKCHEAFFQKEAPCADCDFDEAFTSGKMRIKERWMDLPDGERRWGEVRTYPVYEAEGKPYGTLAIIIDITRRKETQNAQTIPRRIPKGRGRGRGGLRGEAQEQFYNSRFALTDRELEVLGLLSEGFSNGAIADELRISPHTVKSHVIHIFNKLGVNDRTQAAVQGLRHELI